MGQRPSDEYPTPQRLADEITKWALRLHPLTPSIMIGSELYATGPLLKVLEPGAGKHAPFLRAASTQLGWLVELFGIELNDYPQPLHEISWRQEVDFLKPINFSRSGPFDLVITNPPFSLAEQFVERSHQVVHPWGLIVMLFQTGFNGAKSRANFWSTFKPIYKRTIRPRPGFVKSSTEGSKAARDMREYMVVVWPGPALGQFLRNIGRGWCEDGFLDCPHPKGWGMAEE